MSFLRKTEPHPTEIPKKDIMSLAVDKMGDGIGTWEWLRKIDIVRPPRETYTFTIKAEFAPGDDPTLLTPEQLGYLLRRNRVAEVSNLKNITPEHDPNINAGAVPFEEFLAWAKDVKSAHGYCNDFWRVLHEKLGIPLPVHESVQVTFTLHPNDFEAAEIDPGQELNGDTIASVLREVDPEDLVVTPVVAAPTE